VPSLIGRDVGDARQTLRGLGLEMREVGRETSDSAPAQTILRTDPDAGEKVRENGVVSVIVSTGSRQVEVPTLRGRTVDDAKTALKLLDLQIAEPIDRIADAAPVDTIVDQDPPPHQLVEKHSLVHIRVSTGTAPPAGATVVPGDGPKTAEAKDLTPPPVNDAAYDYSLSLHLTDALTAVTVRVDIEDAHGTRTVLEESHDVNDLVQVDAEGYGPKVTFRVYYDGELKHTIDKSAPGSKPAPRRTRRRRTTTPVAPTSPGTLSPPDDSLPPKGDQPTDGQ
jgi:hypothetical protein